MLSMSNHTKRRNRNCAGNQNDMSTSTMHKVGCYGGIEKYIQDFSDRLHLSRKKVTRSRSEEFLSPRRSFRDFFGLRLDKKKTKAEDGAKVVSSTSAQGQHKDWETPAGVQEGQGGESQSSRQSECVKNGSDSPSPAMIAMKSKLAFIKASQKGDLVALHDLVLRFGMSAKEEHMALHFAADSNKRDTLHFLVEHGADVNGADSKNRTPLMYAAYRGNIQAIEKLIEKGANLDYQDKFGSTALMYAATGGQDASCQMLLAKGARIDMLNNDGFSCLVYAVEGGNAYTTQLLIDHGADKNVQNSSGTGILHWAAKRGHMECCRILIENGLHVDGRNHRRVTPLMYAADSKASTESNTKMLEYLIKMGADVNAQDEDCSNPVMYAAHSGCSKNVEILLKYGADPKNSNKYKTTPIMYAAFHGYVDIVSLLIQFNPNLHQSIDNCGMDAIEWAKEGNSTNVISFLTQISKFPTCWFPESHSEFPTSFRIHVQKLLLLFKTHRIENGEILPDELIYEIIRHFWRDLIFDASHPDRNKLLEI